MRISIFDKNNNLIGKLNKCEISKQREHELLKMGAAYASEPVYAGYCDNQIVIDSKTVYEDLKGVKNE